MLRSLEKKKNVFKRWTHRTLPEQLWWKRNISHERPRDSTRLQRRRRRRKRTFTFIRCSNTESSTMVRQWVTFSCDGRCTVYFGTCKIWNFPGLVVIAESRGDLGRRWGGEVTESLVMRDRETFATVIVRRSYRTDVFLRSRASARNIQGTQKTNATRDQKYIPYFCSTFSKYFECLSIRELKRRILWIFGKYCEHHGPRCMYRVFTRWTRRPRDMNTLYPVPRKIARITMEITVCTNVINVRAYLAVRPISNDI